MTSKKDKAAWSESLRIRKMMDDRERPLARALGEQIGFGRMMQLGQELWREYLEKEHGCAGGEFAMGPCQIFMVKCPHTIKDKNGHCDICCGSGQITKGVLELLKKVGKDK